MDYMHRPSGKKLPLFLLKKWRERTQAADKNLKSKASPLVARVFSTAEIEDGLHRTAGALSSMQKQIYRGEELYYEETMPHRNICKGGLEGFVDAKDNVIGDSGLTRSMHQSVRKVPADVRWFSQSRVSKEQMVRENLCIVLSASARKPKIKLPDDGVSSAALETSSVFIPLNEIKQVERQSIKAKRKRNDTLECGDTIPPTRRREGEGLKDAQGSQTTRMNEDNLGKNSQPLPSEDNVSGSTNNLRLSKDATTIVKKEDSKKVDPQRRRRSRRGANS